MRHYNITFTGEGQQKRDDAFTAIENYSEGLTSKLYIYGCDCKTLKQLQFGASFGGVQGYPIKAIWEQIKDDCRSMSE